MSNEMNQNKGRQTQGKAAKASKELTPKQLLRKRKHRIPLRNLVLSSMGDGDLFATLFNLYFYCMSECTDEDGYAWCYPDFSRTIEGGEYDFLYKTDILDNEKNTDKSFISSFNELKMAAIDYYESAEDRQRRRFDLFMKRIGWTFDDIIGKYYDIANENILFYERELPGYLGLFGEFYFSEPVYNDWLGAMSIQAGKNIYPYKIHRLAYWYYAISECINKGWGDFWWWEMSVMTGKDLFDFLTDLQKKSKTSLDKTRDATLDLIDRALRNMRPIIERTSKIQTI